MNKNLRTMCAALAISLLPMGSICYAQTNTSESYESIWVKADPSKEEENEESKKTSAEEYSIEDVVRFKSDKEKYDAYMGKEITLKLKICKLKVSDEQSYMISKDSSMKKAKCVTSKEEANKCKEGDEVIVVGTLKEINGNKILLENTKVIKVIDVNNKEYNKDKYKDKQQNNKCEEKDKCDKKDDKCDKNKIKDAKIEEKTAIEIKETENEDKEKNKVEEKCENEIKNEKIENNKEEKVKE